MKILKTQKTPLEALLKDIDEQTEKRWYSNAGYTTTKYKGEPEETIYHGEDNIREDIYDEINMDTDGYFHDDVEYNTENWSEEYALSLLKELGLEVKKNLTPKESLLDYDEFFEWVKKRYYKEYLNIVEIIKE